jgi:acyl carrier protein
MQLKESNYQSNGTETNASDIIRAWLVNQISKHLRIAAATVKVTEPLTRYGLDSIDSVTIVGEMEDWLGKELPSTLLWDYPTIEKAADYLVDQVGVTPAAPAVAEAPIEQVVSETKVDKGWGKLWNRVSGS